LWIVGVGLLLVVAVVLRLSLLAYTAYVLAGLLVVSRLLARAWIGQVVATRELHRSQIEVGELIAVSVTLENRGRWPVPWVLAEDLVFWPPGIPGPPPVVVKGQRMKLSLLWPRGKATLLYQLRLQERGYYQIGPLVLESGDVFGLHRRYHVAAPPQFVLVYPKVARLEGYDLASRRPIGEIRLSLRLYEDPTRIRGVRLYEPGDPLSRVHWKATARTGRLHSKVYEPSAVAGATLLLNFARADHDGRHEPYRSELAVAAAASLANAVYLMGQQIGLATNGRDAAERVRREGWQHDFRSRRAAQHALDLSAASERLAPLVVETRRGPDQLLRILELLARVELAEGLPFSALVLEVAPRLPRDATVVAILPRVTPEIAAVLGSLRRRGHTVTGILNLYEDRDFAEQAGLLLAEGVAARHLKDTDGLPNFCGRYTVQAS
jgi:uncharacterized protein (DUF58 family)